MLKFVAAAAAVIGLGVAVAPVASADTNSFLQDVRSQGIQGSDNTLVAWGVAVCNDNARGMSAGQIVNNLYQNTGLNADDAGYFFEAASIYLC